MSDEKKKKILDNDKFTAWTIIAPKGKKARDELEKKMNPVCALDEDNLLYMSMVAEASPNLWPVVAFKFFVLHKLSTDEYYARFVTEFALNDDDPVGTHPRKKVMEMTLRAGSNPKESAFGMAESLKKSGLIVGEPKVTDFSKCKTMDEVLGVFGIPKEGR